MTLHNRSSRRSLLTGIAAAGFALLRRSQAIAAPQHGERTVAPAVVAPPQKVREGTTLTDVNGYFKASGDRFTFLAEGETRPITCLENLGLERIGKTISDSTVPVLWSVSGVVTEYQNSNYLLVTRALKRSSVVTPRGGALPSAQNTTGRPARQ